MKLTKKKAISECKELWKEIEESGKDKYDFFHSPDGEKWVEKDYQLGCPLCEYTLVSKVRLCGFACPLVLQYNRGCDTWGWGADPPDPKFFEAVRGLK